ncbi:hypothetical protein ACN9MN_08070 [Chryseobacterium sp. S-02]|uniref:hypothetical protein n=1 Tax=Chryseobacterium sp. S-02 TaxID=3404064 RepID=UPI003CF1B6B0
MNSRLTIIQLEELQDLADKEKYVFINFPDEYSIKVIPFFEKIGKKERNDLVKLFYQLTNIEIMIDDFVGKIHLVLLKILMDGEKNNIIVSNVGLSNNSYTFWIENLSKLFNNFDNKNLIILENIFNTPDFKYTEK